jgi:hypothetical protein
MILPGSTKLPRVPHQKTSALSAASSFILWSSSAEDSEKERFFPKRDKRTTNRRDPGERREDENANDDPCCQSFGRKCSAVSACSAVIFFSFSYDPTGDHKVL